MVQKISPTVKCVGASITASVFTGQIANLIINMYIVASFQANIHIRNSPETLKRQKGKFCIIK